jgi:hypothetical protein
MIRVGSLFSQLLQTIPRDIFESLAQKFAPVPAEGPNFAR